MSVKLLFFILILSLHIEAQNYWVYFKDKQGVWFDPYAYFDSKAIERRMSIGYNLYDSSDFPVNEHYIQVVCELVDSISYASRWMNALAVWADEWQIQNVAQLPFVVEVERIDSYGHLCTADTAIELFDVESITWYKQIDVMGAKLFFNRGITGKGVRIAVLDAGFKFVDTHPVFAHLREQGRILKTWDFVRHKSFVYDHHIHGTMVLSCIAGYSDVGGYMGLAPDAEFLLARTERRGEPYAEEVNWAAAMEWADQHGADIINSSLGYTYHRYFPYQMDGQTAFVTRMANKAASKGILVVNAAGNDGDTDWRFLGAPADADSVLTVGGVDPETHLRISFSSYGPTADLRRKPDVVAYAHTYVANRQSITKAYGTSFAAPLVTGFAACVKQLFPHLNAMELKETIIQSAHLYPYFDYAHGYGIPLAAKLLDTVQHHAPVFWIELKSEMFSFETTQQIIDLSKNTNVGFNYLYYSVLDDRNVVCNWAVIKVEKQRFEIPIRKTCENARRLCVHFAGQTVFLDLFE